MGSRRMRIVIAVCAPAMNIHDPHRDDAAGAGRDYRRAGTRSSIVKGARAHADNTSAEAAAAERGIH